MSAGALFWRHHFDEYTVSPFLENRKQKENFDSGIVAFMSLRGDYFLLSQDDVEQLGLGTAGYDIKVELQVSY